MSSVARKRYLLSGINHKPRKIVDVIWSCHWLWPMCLAMLYQNPRLEYFSLVFSSRTYFAKYGIWHSCERATFSNKTILVRKLLMPLRQTWNIYFTRLNIFQEINTIQDEHNMPGSEVQRVLSSPYNWMPGYIRMFTFTVTSVQSAMVESCTQ